MSLSASVTLGKCDPQWVAPVGCDLEMASDQLVGNAPEFYSGDYYHHSRYRWTAPRQHACITSSVLPISGR